MKEYEQKTGKEKWAGRLKWGGIIAGVLGLLAEIAPVAIVGAGLALSGVIFESNKKQVQPQAA